MSQTPPAPLSEEEAYQALYAELASQTLPEGPAATLWMEVAPLGRVTCILPYRADPARNDAALLAQPRLDGRMPRGLAFLLVDDGSPPETWAATRAACQTHGYSHLHIASADRPFCTSRCHNLGAMHARGQFLLLQQLDALPHDGFHATLLEAIAAEGLEADGKRFLRVPSLSAGPSDLVPGEARAVRPNRQGGTLLVHRLWYLARGGIRWEGPAGLHELRQRLLRHLGEPDDAALTERMLARGLVLRHAKPAEALGDAPPEAPEPEPLACAHAGRSLVFRQNAYTAGRIARPLLGRLVHLRHGTMLRSAAMLARLMRELRLDRVLFFNPYQTPHMEKIYHWVRQQNLPHLCAERGALPGSSFFDAGGFLSDSASYAASQWDHPLGAAEEALVRRYIAATLQRRPALERQPASMGGALLRARLGLSPAERLIFIPLQRPGDTVTRFLTRGVIHDEFLREVGKLAATLPAGWRLAVKTHPLETEPLNAANCVNADAYHVDDLLEACDLVWTFNSGVGLLAMLHGRPVLYTGAAFYAAPGVNRHVGTAAEVLACLVQPPQFDTVRSRRFLHHLLTRLYSFGEHVTRQKTLTTGGNITETLDIRYERLVLGGQIHRFLNPGRPSFAPDA